MGELKFLKAASYCNPEKSEYVPVTSKRYVVPTSKVSENPKIFGVFGLPIFIVISFNKIVSLVRFPPVAATSNTVSSPHSINKG